MRAWMRSSAQPVRGETAVLVEFVATFIGDGFDSAFHRDAVCAAQQVEAVFIPKIDAGLQADANATIGNSSSRRWTLRPTPKISSMK